MLVLTRKVGDVIAIGDNIKIVVMAIKGKQVRLGVQADRSTVVHREEIYQKIQQEIRAALQSDMVSTKAAGDLLRNVAEGGSTTGSGGRPDAPRPPQTSGKKGPTVLVTRAAPSDAESEDDEAPATNTPPPRARVPRRNPNDRS